MQDAFIVGGYRTAVGKAGKGSLRFTRPDDLAATIIKKILSDFPMLEPNRIDDLIVGCAMPEGEQGLNMARMIGLISGLPISVPAMTVNRFCASGLETIAIATSKIRAGLADVVLAGGAESMSLVPMSGYKTSPNPGIVESNPGYYLNMGLTAEMVSQKYKVSREDQDQFAFRSHQLAGKAIKEGKFEDGILPISVERSFLNEKCKLTKETTEFKVDEGVRLDTTVEKLSTLKPVFMQGGVVTAGNSSQTSDGAAMVLVVSEKVVKELNLTPIARLVTSQVAGVDPELMGIGPVAAIPKALKRANLKLDDIAVTELNEAFAAQAVAVIREVGLNPDKVNVNGGAIALGHPLGCTGTKLSIQLFSELRRRKAKYGMVTACVGGGQGIAGIFELIG